MDVFSEVLKMSCIQAMAFLALIDINQASNPPTWHAPLEVARVLPLALVTPAKTLPSLQINVWTTAPKTLEGLPNSLWYRISKMGTQLFSSCT